MKKFLLIIALIISGMGLNARNVTDVANNDSQLSFANIAVEESEIPDDCYELVFNLTDMYGDGWEGGSLLVEFNETTENLTIENGRYAAFSFIIPKGTVINLTIIPGQYPSEVGFNLSIKGYVMLNIAQGTYNNNNEVNYEIVVPQRLPFIENSLAETVGLAEDGETIFLTEDLAGEGAVIDKDIVIDFGGHTYSLTEGVGSGTLTSNGIQILQGNNVTLKNGCLKVADDYKQNFYILVQNYANLTIEDMHLDGTNLDKYSSTDQDSYVLSNNSGNVNIIGNTNITANDEGDKAFAFDVCKYANYDAPTVSVNTIGEISGNIEVSEGLDGNLNITGGTFTMDVTPWCPYGFFTESDENGIYDVVKIATGNSLTIDYNGYSLTYTITNTDVFPFECSVRCSAQPTAPTAITIPETVEINGVEVNVTSIKNEAFRGCSSLTSIEIPSAVTTIEEYAFAGCSSLEKLVFEENSQLTTIRNNTFEGCSSLTSIEIPSSVTTIGESAFSGCSNLVKVAFEENSQLKSIEDYLFSGCRSLRSIEIPNSVKSIGYRSFGECRALTSITFEENSQLVSIGEAAFSNIFPNFKSIEIPSSVKEIKDEAFSSCWDLENITFEENSQLTSLGQSVFEGTPIKEIELPSCLTAISPSAFKGCEQLKSVFIPKNVEYIRNFAFQNCSQLETVIIEEGSKLTSINDLSFSGCNNLQKIVIPSGVTYIGFESFSNCNNMTMVECYATDVPQTDSDAFNGCPERMRIQVPAESLEKYQAETPWNNYTLVTEIVRHEIVTSINKEYMGTTEGDGTYFNGESVTVKATAREYGSSWWDENGQWHSFYDNSTFVYWTENGEFVSREQEYTFVAEADRNLQANFMNNNHWTADPGISSHNMTVWADVQLEGVSANNINIEIGAFCDGELRGNARIQYFEAVDKFMYQLVIYGTNNDNIKFKLYDHNTQKEMEYLSHDYLTFVEDATHGSVGAPKVINFIPISRIPIEVVCNIPEACDVEGAGDYFQGEQVTITANDVEGFLFKNWTLDGEVISTDKSYTFRVERQLRFVANYEYAHVRHLNKGWNWYSTYMQLSGAEGLETVQSALGSAATQIKSQTAFDTYEYGEWIGALDEYYTEKMYMIDINSYYGQDITIKGTPANPSDYTIELKPNWNWVGYPVSYNMSIEEALQNITPMHGDYFKSQTHFSQYYEGAGWLGALQTLEKGQGYMYQNISGETREFVYPNQSNAKSELKSNASLANNYWNANMSAYPTNMSIIAIVENNGMEMSDYEIAAFSNGECRGSARPIYIEQLDVYMTFLTICGEVGETLTFKYYDVASAETYTLSSVITYAANATLGTIDTPYIMSMSTTGINENTYDKVNVYPNPVNVNSELYLETECDNVEIYNALGVRIAEYENVSKIDGIETSGVYVIKVTEQGNVKYNRIVVK